MRDAKGRFCKPQFKVGDPVDARSCGRECVNGTIVAIDNSSLPFLVSGCWNTEFWCYGDNVTLHIEEYKPTPQEPPSSPITLGTSVRLKSGGPTMTVEHVGPQLSVKWFSHGIMREGLVNIESVEVVNE